MKLLRRSVLTPVLCLLVFGTVATVTGDGQAAEKFIALEPIPARGKLNVTPDGSHVLIASTDYLVFDNKGTLEKTIGFSPWGTGPVQFVQRSDGWYFALVRGLSGRIDVLRPDGSVSKAIANVGGELFADPNWANPDGMAVDFENKRIFVLDALKVGNPSPSNSRITVLDFDGKRVGTIGNFPGTQDDVKLQTTYRDIAVDPKRKVVYATSCTPEELRAWQYDGKFIGKVACRAGNGDVGGGICVLPDGRIVTGILKEIRIFSPELKETEKLQIPAEIGYTDYHWNYGIKDLDADAAGRVYATVGNPAITYVRWSPDFKSYDIFWTRYLQLNVDYPAKPLQAGASSEFKVAATGRPSVPETKWEVLARRSDGTDLTWNHWPATLAGDVLKVDVPADAVGLYDVAVRFGEGQISIAEREKDPYVQQTVAVIPANVKASITAVTANGRHGFQQGESIPIQLVRREATVPAANARVTVAYSLNDSTGAKMLSGSQALETVAALEIPATVTGRLLPGHYVFTLTAAGYHGYPLNLDIGPPVPDSPMQRILYGEFNGGGCTGSGNLADLAERLASIRDYAQAMTRQGFTRETERYASIGNDAAWDHNHLPVALIEPAFAAPEYYSVPTGGTFEPDTYYDQCAARNIQLDGMLLAHCAGVPCCDASRASNSMTLQRFVQSRSRYPSFYGVNYNDEMFFRSYGWSDAEEKGLKEIIDAKFKGKPVADAYKYTLELLYNTFNTAVRRASPQAKLTTTPMWQFPAVEGSYAPTIYKNMSESYGHYMTEGQHPPYFPAHNSDFLRRPGLPVMGVFDNGHSGAGGDLYMIYAMQVLGRGVQGIGVDLTNALAGPGRGNADPSGADAYRVTNLLAKMYGPVYAETAPIYEGAILYSYTQDLTEGRHFFGTPHWERVFALYSAGLMANTALRILYEEDVTAGWLLEKGKPRVPALFLVGQKQKLPADVEAAIKQFIAAGGKLFAEDSPEKAENGAAKPMPPPLYPEATAIDLNTRGFIEASNGNANNDSMWASLQPYLEKVAADLKTATGALRRSPVDTDDPWVNASCFDGGGIRYISLASNSAPYPWSPGLTWSTGATYMRSFPPKTVSVKFPAWGPVVYDVFDGERVKTEAAGEALTVKAEVKNFPGRLYAVAPAPLGAPAIATAVQGGTLHYRVTATDESGKTLPARVPLRIRLLNGKVVANELFRGTDVTGNYTDTLILPSSSKTWALEVTELLSGKGSTAEVATTAPPAAAAVARPDVEIQREAQLRDLLQSAKSKGELALVTAHEKVLSEAQVKALAAAFEKAGIKLKPAPIPNPAAPGMYLAAGSLKDNKDVGDILGQARLRGLFEFTLTENIPGAGRGFVSPLFSSRVFNEDTVALVGGDAAGLAKTVDAFVEWLGKSPPGQTANAAKAGPAAPHYTPESKAANVPAIPRLKDLVGTRLAAVVPAADGKHLLVTARGYHRNLAVLEDAGDKPQLTRVARIGQAPGVESAYISADGALFGASAREVSRIGEAFHLIDASTGQQKVFAAFGDYERRTHQFAATANGDLVITPGQYGLVAWKKDGEKWKEAWAREYWKEFDKLEWPVDNSDERTPQFHAFIPRNADYAVITFSETTDNGWVVPEHHYRANVFAVNLADGKERWRFEIPIPDQQMFTSLNASPDGSRLLLQVQLGSWTKKSYRFYALDNNGQPLAYWNCASAPLSIAVANGTGNVAEVFASRLLEVRKPDGTVLHNRIWDGCSPLSIAFAADGQSLFVADSNGELSRLDPSGKVVWRTPLGCTASIAVANDHVYAAGWDGRLRSYSADGKQRWVIDLTPDLDGGNPLADAVASAELKTDDIVQTARPSTATQDVPPGQNLLQEKEKVLVKVAGVGGWLSEGKVLVKASDLINGKVDDVDAPWLPLAEVNMTGATGRQCYVEMEFKAPADLTSLTVYENTKHPEAWPTESVIQVWNEAQKRWLTVKRGVFLNHAVNTYALDLKNVTKLRYVPWACFARNFYTSEIEVRGKMGEPPAKAYRTVIGPFPETFETEFGPEKGIDLKKTYTGKDGQQVAWRRTFVNAEGYVDFMPLFEKPEHASAYAVMWVKCPTARKATVSAGSDDGIRCWVNGKLVLNNNAYRGAAPGQDKASVDLVQGVNEILVKITQGGGAWGYYLDLLNAEGKPMDDLEYTLPK